MLIKSSRLSTFVITISLLLVSGGISQIYENLYSISNRSGGNLVFQVVSFFIYCFFLFRTIYMWSFKSKQLFLNSLPLFILISFCLVSFLWSIEPATSIRRAFALLLTTFFAFYIANWAKDYSSLLKVFLRACLLIAILALFSALIPGWGYDSSHIIHSDALRGMTGQKNELGRYMAVGILLAFISSKAKKENKVRYFIMMLFFAVILLLTTSKTPLSILVLLFFLYPIIFYIKSGKTKLSRKIHTIKLRTVILSFVVLMGVLLTIAALNYFLELMGRDLSFSGRTSIWNYAIEKSKANIILGTGYRTFWIDSFTLDFSVLNLGFGEGGFTNGHNGFIDVYLETGVIGSFIFASFLFHYIAMTLKTHNKLIFVSSAVFLTFYFLYSITEQVTLKQSELFWIFLTSNYFYLAKEKKHVSNIRR